MSRIFPTRGPSLPMALFSSMETVLWAVALILPPAPSGVDGIGSLLAWVKHLLWRLGVHNRFRASEANPRQGSRIPVS